MKYYFLIVTILFITLPLIAQDTLQSEEFYLSHKDEYINFLNKKKITEVLDFNSLQIIDNKYLYIYLTFKFSDRDSLIGSWNSITNYYRDSFEINVDEIIFYSAVTIFQIPPTLLLVNITDIKHPSPIIDNYIEYLNGNIVVDSSGSLSGIEPMEFEIDLEKNNIILEKFYEKRKTAYSLIYKIIKDFYKTRQQINTSQVQFEKFEKKDHLLIKISNLQEVVLQEDKPGRLKQVYLFFGISEEAFLKWEQVHLKITFNPIDQENGLISIKIKARYASKYQYKESPPHWQKMKNIEGRYSVFLQEHQDHLENYIKEQLKY